MSFKYYLPDEECQKVEHSAESNAVIIIGANGSGKSKLGAWIEQQDMHAVHRIGAQRKLNFNENIALKNFAQAENYVFYGTDDTSQRLNKNHRWNFGREYTTKLIDDFENVLAALIALKNNENDQYIRSCKDAESNGSAKPHTPFTVFDKLQSIWKDVFPHRNIELDDAKFFASFVKGDEPVRYNANQMSDGERSVLYLAAQVLCVPQNKTLIMDEPELHLHRSIMNRLWASLEQHRPDCLFIYITHDTQFAAMHTHATKIWIKEFDGTKWNFEIIEDNELPDDLLLEILGSRKDVLFVEGTQKNSYDTQLYTLIYPKYYIVPCGSCEEVIKMTRAFRAAHALHECSVYGIIDRDFKSDEELNNNAGSGIFAIKVAEVENLFIVENVIRLMAKHMGKDDASVFENIKKYVIEERFLKQLESQICKCIKERIHYLISKQSLSGKNVSDIKEQFTNIPLTIDIEHEITEIQNKFSRAKDDYEDVIKIFNEKGIAKSIGRFLGIQNNQYCQVVLDIIRNSQNDEMIRAIKDYLPNNL